MGKTQLCHSGYVGLGTSGTPVSSFLKKNGEVRLTSITLGPYWSADTDRLHTPPLTVHPAQSKTVHTGDETPDVILIHFLPS